MRFCPATSIYANSPVCVPASLKKTLYDANSSPQGAAFWSKSRFAWIVVVHAKVASGHLLPHAVSDPFPAVTLPVRIPVLVKPSCKPNRSIICTQGCRNIT